MDEKSFEELVERLKRANTAIESLDPVIRDDAWRILRPYVTGEATKASSASHDRGAEEGETPPEPDSTEDELLEKFESEKEAENLYLTLAILYKRHGKGPFDMDYIRSVGKALHLSLPDRPDTTLRNSRKKEVRKQEGGYKILPGGERWLKETYGVTKGKQPIPGNQ